MPIPSAHRVRPEELAEMQESGASRVPLGRFAEAPRIARDHHAGCPGCGAEPLTSHRGTVSPSASCGQSKSAASQRR